MTAQFWSSDPKFPIEDWQYEMLRLRSINAELLEALKAAQQHLDYCGYGDSWEHECAKASGLEKQIDAAIAKATGGDDV